MCFKVDRKPYNIETPNNLKIIKVIHINLSYQTILQIIKIIYKIIIIFILRHFTITI